MITHCQIWLTIGDSPKGGGISENDFGYEPKVLCVKEYFHWLQTNCSERFYTRLRVPICRYQLLESKKRAGLVKLVVGSCQLSVRKCVSLVSARFIRLTLSPNNATYIYILYIYIIIYIYIILYLYICVNLVSARFIRLTLSPNNATYIYIYFVYI